MNRLLAPALLAASILSYAVAAGAATPAAKTPPFNFEAEPASQSNGYVDVSGGRNFGDIKKLAIMNFNIEFTTFREASNSRSSSSWSQNALGFETRTTSTTSEYKSRTLPLPERDKLQALVDKAYTDLTSQLSAMGIEIVPYATIKAMPEYENFKSAMHDSPWVTETKDSNSIFMAPTGMPLYMDNLERANFLQGISGMVSNTAYQEMKVIFALPDTALLSVNMVVDFATVEAEKGFLSSLSSKVNADMVHHLQARNSSFRFMGYGQPRSVVVSLDKHLVSDKKFWSDASPEKAAGDDKSAVAQTDQKSSKSEGVGLFGFIGGGSKGEEKVFLYDMGLYYSRSEDMMLAMQRMFVSELAKLKK